MSYHQRDEIRWNKRGYYERFDGKKYWRKLCIIEGCMKRAKVLNWCKRHYTEEKQKSFNATSETNPSSSSSSTTPSNIFHSAHSHAVSQIPMPTPSYLYTALSASTLTPSSSNSPVRNEIRLNKRGYREQFDGIAHWRPLCIFNQCSKRAKKLSYCKRHYTEHFSQTQPNVNSMKED